MSIANDEQLDRDRTHGEDRMKETRPPAFVGSLGLTGRQLAPSPDPLAD